MNALHHDNVPTHHWGGSHDRTLLVSSTSTGVATMHQTDWIDSGRPSVPARCWARQSATPESIRDEYLPKLRQLQQAAQQACANGQATKSISLMFDLVSEEAWMVRSMAVSVGGSPEDFVEQRFIRRTDIDALMACAQEVGDCDAKLLAEVLLQTHQRHIVGEIARREEQSGLFDSFGT